MKDIWFIGDSTLYEWFPTLPAMRREARIAKNSPPYLYDQYNATSFQCSSSSQISNVLLQIVNSFTEAINKHRMPRHIVVLLNTDLMYNITTVNLPGSSNQIAKCLTWLSGFIENSIEAKKEEMFNIRSGSLSPCEPKVIWIAILPFSAETVTIKSERELLRLKYNAILEETLVHRKNNYFLNPDNAVTQDCFDRNGHLTATGKIKIWKEIDFQIYEFDRQRISLKPAKVVSIARQKETAHKLPTPPPREGSRTKISVREYKNR